MEGAGTGWIGRDLGYGKAGLGKEELLFLVGGRDAAKKYMGCCDRNVNVIFERPNSGITVFIVRVHSKKYSLLFRYECNTEEERNYF